MVFFFSPWQLLIGIILGRNMNTRLSLSQTNIVFLFTFSFGFKVLKLLIFLLSFRSGFDNGSNNRQNKN